MKKVAGFLAALVMAFGFGSIAVAQTTTAECSKGCTFAADPPQDGTVVSCVLKGLPAGDIEKPVIDSASITPPVPAGAALKAKTCWWPNVVIAPGNYTATAISKAADGRVSVPSTPLAFTVSPVPVGVPSAPRLVILGQ
jgi:hypothetical protein